MWKFWIGVSIAFLVTAMIGVYFIFFMPNVEGERRITVKIPTGSTYTDVLRILKERNALRHQATFEIVSRFKGYDKRVRAGNYVFTPGMDNRLLVNTLRMGWQTPVTLVIYNIRTKEEFAGLVGRTLELDSSEFLNRLNDEKFCRQFGLDTNNILTRFIPDNYQFYWNVSMEQFIKKTEIAYQRFWNEARLKKAQQLRLQPFQVTILASIVEKEVIFDKELTTVAGVYLNRLRIGMPLQADPTLVFAARDFNARRVTARHRAVNSRYNTYQYAGLPPGPICIPRKKSMDAVLNADKHTYLYFCANPDMSGYSIFSTTLKEQNKVAAQYRKKLDKMNIR